MTVSNLEKIDFINRMLPYAIECSRQSGIHFSVILAQWACESSYGSSEISKYNNFAGIKRGRSNPGPITPVDLLPSGTRYRSYTDVIDFARGWLIVIKNGYYTDVIAAKTITTQTSALAASAWAGGHYRRNGIVGGALEVHFPLINTICKDIDI